MSNSIINKKKKLIITIFSVLTTLILLTGCSTPTKYVQVNDLNNVTTGKQVLVISQTTCPACTNFKENILTQMADELQQKTQVLELDIVDKTIAQDVIKKYNIMYTPTIVFLQDGKLIESFGGKDLISKEKTEQIIQNFLNSK